MSLGMCLRDTDGFKQPYTIIIILITIVSIWLILRVRHYQKSFTCVTHLIFTLVL